LNSKNIGYVILRFLLINHFKTISMKKSKQANKIILYYLVVIIVGVIGASLIFFLCWQFLPWVENIKIIIGICLAYLFMSLTLLFSKEKLKKLYKKDK
jgi:hypothetical protein